MSAPHILLLEDESALARAIARRLKRDGYTLAVCGTLADARQAVAGRRPDVAVIDLRLPDGYGLEFLEWLRGEAGAVPAVILTAFGELDDAIVAMRLGAMDFLKKPLDIDALGKIVHDALDRPTDDVSPTAKEKGAPEADAGTSLIGDSPAMAAVHEQIERIAVLGAGDAPPNVLITGETGTGKDLIARAVHAASPRKTRPFLRVDCAALPRDLIEAELFGHEKGAFTSAVRARRGLLAAAGSGTAFLNEIGELPLALQAKLLTALESRTIREIGSDRDRAVDAWFIAATNRDLAAMLEAGEFRSDLFYRLNVLTLAVPPLRERGDDILALASHFVTAIAQRYDRAVPDLTDDARAALLAHRWPGNVRELRHVIERAVLVGADDRLTAEHLRLPGPRAAPDKTTLTQAGTREAAAGSSAGEATLAATERDLIARTLVETGDNISAAARRLGLSRGALRYRLEKYGLGGNYESGTDS